MSKEQIDRFPEIDYIGLLKNKILHLTRDSFPEIEDVERSRIYLWGSQVEELLRGFLSHREIVTQQAIKQIQDMAAVVPPRFTIPSKLMISQDEEERLP